MPERGQDLVSLGANRVVAGLRLKRSPPVAGNLGGGRAALGDPPLARAIEELDVVMAVVLQVPIRVRGKPVVAVAVEDPLVGVGDPTVPEQPAELLFSEEVAPNLIPEILALSDRFGAP